MKRKNVFNDYEIQENGDIYSLKYNKLRKLKPSLGAKGYFRVAIYTNGKQKTIEVHRLVAAVYLQPRPSPKYEIRHIDGIKTNNHYSNLVWGTHKENMGDRDNHGATAIGERNGKSKLIQAHVDRIRFLVGKVPYGYWSKLARALCIDASVVTRIVNNQAWVR